MGNKLKYALKYGLIFVLALIVFQLWVPRQGFNGGSCCLFSRPQTFSANAKDVGNKICPVSGRTIGVMGPGVVEEYKGKIYHLCCGACVSTFESDPAKYSKIADDQVKATKNNY
jgi:YHS domain-containing protein